MARKMMSIGSIENAKITTGPKFFDVDLHDHEEFPSPGTATTVARPSRVDEDIGDCGGRPKKLSKERRLKAKKVPLAEFLKCEDSVPPPHTVSDDVAVPPPPEVSEDHVRVKRRPSNHKTKFDMSGCADMRCRPEGAE